MKRIISIFAMVIVVITYIAASPTLAQQPKIVDDALRSEIHLMWSGGHSIVVPYSEIDQWETKAHASGMIASVRNKVTRGETGYYTGQALGNAASQFADQVVLQQNGGDKNSLGYKGWRKSRGTPEMRQATSKMFVDALIRGATNGASSQEVSVDDFQRIADKVVELEARCDSLEANLRVVAHNAAIAADKDRDYKKERKPAIDWLARY